MAGKRGAEGGEAVVAEGRSGVNAPGWRTDADIQRAQRLEFFPEMMLGLKTEGWQREVLKAIEPKESRVALKACNGSGKTSVVVASAVMWHLVKFPGSLVVCTAGVFRQISQALWPALRSHCANLGGEATGFRVLADAIHYVKPGQRHVSRVVGFSAKDPHKAEGWHRQGPTNNLLYVIDEAKAPQDGIFESMDRCQPSRTLLVSSPGGAAGYFYETFRRNDGRWRTFTVPAFQCPWLVESGWIESQIERYGENHPAVRSSVFAEFVEDDGSATVLKASDWQKCRSNPRKGDVSREAVVAGCDFAAGGDENVLVLRQGFRVLAMVRWKAADTMETVGRFMAEFRKWRVEAKNVFADVGGLGVVMCDAMREQGFDVNRVNFGIVAIQDERFKTKAAEMWLNFGRKVEKGEVDLGPVAEDEATLFQFLNRKMIFTRDGKISLQTKDDLRSHGVSSPDRADALVLAFEGGGTEGMQSYQRQMDAEVPMSLMERFEEEFGPVYGAHGATRLAGCHVGA